MCVTCNGRVLVPQPYEETQSSMTPTGAASDPGSHSTSDASSPLNDDQDNEITNDPFFDSQPSASSTYSLESSEADFESSVPAESHGQDLIPDAYASEEFHPRARHVDTVPVPRTILYAIGGLIVTVGVGSFLLGWGMARSLAPVQIKQATRQSIHGSVRYATRRGQLAPDTQSVVVALPTRRLPDQKFAPETLRPDILSFSGQNLAVQGIRSLGGDVALTNEAGEYELEVGDAGEYFVLILSGHVALPNTRRATSTHIVELGQYFRQADKLLGKNDYVWNKYFVRKSKQVDKTFD